VFSFPVLVLLFPLGGCVWGFFFLSCFLFFSWSFALWTLGCSVSFMKIFSPFHFSRTFPSSFISSLNFLATTFFPFSLSVFLQPSLSALFCRTSFLFSPLHIRAIAVSTFFVCFELPMLFFIFSPPDCPLLGLVSPWRPPAFFSLSFTPLLGTLPLSFPLAGDFVACLLSSSANAFRST